MGAAASGVFFVASDPVARTHHAALVAAALAYTHATQSGLGKAAVVSQKFEVSFGFPGGVGSAEAKVLIEFVGLDQLAGIHLPVGVPGGLKLAEGLHQLRAEHFGKQLATGLAVAVLAGEGAALAHDEVGGLLHKLTELGDAVLRSQIEVDAGVDAAVAEVAVE